jgi:hypothetical protein
MILHDEMTILAWYVTIFVSDVTFFVCERMNLGEKATKIWCLWPGTPLASIFCIPLTHSYKKREEKEKKHLYTLLQLKKNFVRFT